MTPTEVSGRSRPRVLSAVLVLIGFVVFGAFLRRMDSQFHSLDTAHFDRVGSTHR